MDTLTLTPPDGAQYVPPVGSPWPKALSDGELEMRYLSSLANAAIYVTDAGVLYDVTEAADGTFNGVIQEVGEEDFDAG